MANIWPADEAMTMTLSQGRIRAAVVGNSPDFEASEILAAQAPEAGVSSVFAQLIDGFARARVAWCYWKSSRRAAAALAGETDLDILVARDSQHQARRVLLECGFRHFAAVANRADPSIECYLSHDENSGQLAHVDLHMRLTLGGALLKTHRLPWEDSLIRRAVPREGSKLPLLDAASEAVLLVVRACLELRRSDPVVARNWASMTKKFALDRALLATRVDREAVRARAVDLLDEGIATSIADALFDPRPLQDQRDLRRRVRWALARFRTYSSLEGFVRGAWRACGAAAGRLNQRALLWPRPWHRRVPGGGIVVAVLGVDGAGKSTLVRALRGWLGPEVDVLPLYFGTGDGRPSWFLWPLKLLVPLVSMLWRRKPKGSSHGVVTNNPPGLAYSLLLAIWATVLAVEKRVKFRAAHRAASRGMVVITDRFSQDEILNFNDGPMLPRLAHVPRWLRAFEASAYALARELRPDLVIKLMASPELIAAREPTMDPDVIRERTAAVGRLTFGGACIIAIAASQPAADVLRAAKIELWRTL
jgi:hypothetical protein